MSAPAVSFRERVCPICGAGHGRGRLFLERTYDPARVNAFSYASRKNPEYMNFRLLRCQGCDVVYASESPEDGALHEAYHQAQYDSSEEAKLAAKAYAMALSAPLEKLAGRGRVLEIGAGTGAFLETLAPLCFRELLGVEPSAAALAAAAPAIRPSLVEGIFREADHRAASFSFICCFMTLEHVPDPGPLMKSVFRLLEPGGLAAFVTHDWRAWNNRVLGRRSPIIDLEHLQLFSRQSLNHLLTTAGLVDFSCAPLRNVYPLAYWNRLFPFPGPMKRLLEAVLRGTGLGGVRVGLNVGNLVTCGWKPE